MEFHNYKKASDYAVREWLENSLEMTKYQKQKLRDEEIIRFSPFTFMERRKKTKNPLMRLTILFFPFVWIILFLGLPFNFLITGSWGYTSDMKWYYNWLHNIGL